MDVPFFREKTFPWRALRVSLEKRGVFLCSERGGKGFDAWLLILWFLFVFKVVGFN